MKNGTIINQYKILAPIGKGGMGEVFLAQDTKLDRRVALKILPSEFAADADRMSRFVREAKSVSALNHPNILTIHEFGTEGATHYLASEFIDGETLRDRLQRAPLSLNETLDVAVQTAQALAAAQEANIIHRDIKPENVMLRKDGIIKVLDFGLAKLTPLRNEDREDAATLMQSPDGNPQSPIPNPQLTMPGMVMGTVAYMSPEQARGNPVDARTDLFSLGGMLYEMLARRQPFTGETINHVIVAILEKEPPPLEGVPAELRRILEKALAKKADERYGSAPAMLADLKKLQMRLLVEAENQRNSSDDAPVEAQTLILPQTTAAAPEGLATAAASAQLTSPDNPKLQKWWLAAGLSLLFIVGGYVGYGYFTATKQINSIAVLPFENRSGNADSEYLSDGLAESLIYRLSQLPDLKVSPTSSVFRYKGKEADLQVIAKELGVDSVMTGRITERGDNLTISVNLVDMRNGKSLWGEQYERKLSELLATQREIAAEITNKLQLKLSGAGEQKLAKTYTNNNEAYQLYLKGRFYWNRRTGENLKKAIEQFKAATDRDPNYALAYSGLADCYALLPEYAGTSTNETRPQVKAFAERAIAIDDQLAEAHASLGQAHKQAWQWAEAEREYKRAIELNPKYATAYHWYFGLLRILGRFDEAALMIKKAQELDPLSSVIGVNISMMYQGQTNHQASVENLLRIIELDPNFSAAYDYLGQSYLKLGRKDEAIANLGKAVQLSNRSGVALMNLGSGYGATGKRTEAIAILNELEQKYSKNEALGLYVANVYAGLGDKDKAFDWLEKGFQNKEDLGVIRWRIPFESLRDDPRFKDLLKRMNLPE